MNRTIRTLAAATLVAMATAGTAAAADKLTLTMNWRADSAHLGFALAQKQGLYAAEGLDVTLQEGRGSSVAAQLVATGQSEIGRASCRERVSECV